MNALKENTINQTKVGTPVLEDETRWLNSSNVLCNYMKKQEYLDYILKNSAIVPRYVIEPIEYLGIPNLKQICFPMTCFCDIPFSKVSTHMSIYGEYGIAIDKSAMMARYRVQPIQYICSNSPLLDDYKEAYLAAFELNDYYIENKLSNEVMILANYTISSLMYMKPIKGWVINDTGEKEERVYQEVVSTSLCNHL